MTIQIDLWQFITWGVGLLIVFLGFVGGMLKWSFMQHEQGDRERYAAQAKANQERYETQERTRAEASKRWAVQFDEIDRRLDNHAERVTRIEATTANSPTHDDLAALHKRIDKVASAIDGLQGEFKGASHTLQLIHSYLLKGDKE